jgi:hypothetical protein
MDDQSIYKEIVMNIHEIHSVFHILMAQIMIRRDPVKQINTQQR